MSYYSTDTYSVTSTGEVTDKIKLHDASGKGTYLRWILSYSLNGVTGNKAFYTQFEVDSTTTTMDAEKAATTLTVTGFGGTKNEAGYYESRIKYVSVDDEKAFWTSQIVDRGGMSGEGPPTEEVTTMSSLVGAYDLGALDLTAEPGLTPAQEQQADEAHASAERAAAQAAATSEPHSALYLSSMSKTMRIVSKTGLIAQDSFRLKWNDMRYPAFWSQEVTQKYNEIQSGADPGKIAIIKNNIYIPRSESGTGYGSYNLFYDLNTGMKQMAPHVERRRNSDGGVDSFTETETATCDVYYGRVEGDALEDKYKRFSGDYGEAMDSAIDGMVNDAISQMRTKSKYNFRRVDTNKSFKRRNLSLFFGESQSTEALKVTTATAISTMPSAPPMGSSY